MARRLLIAGALVAGAAALTGCVVVPTEPAYGYGPGGGYGYSGPPVVRVAPPPVVVTPPPVYRYHRYPRPYRGW